MPQYLVKMVHSPSECPSANSTIRDRMTKSAAQLPQMAQQAGVKFLMGPIVLAVEHESITLVEAASAEAVNEFLIRAGLMQWNTVRVSVAATMEQVMKDMEKMPPPVH